MIIVLVVHIYPTEVLQVHPLVQWWFGGLHACSLSKADFRYCGACLQLQQVPVYFLRACTLWASLVSQMVKNPPATWETPVRSLGWEEPLEKGMAPTPIFWAGEFHGQRSLMGYSSRPCKELYTTE